MDNCPRHNQCLREDDSSTDIEYTALCIPKRKLREGRNTYTTELRLEASVISTALYNEIDDINATLQHRREP